MNLFFGVKGSIVNSKLTVPRFQNSKTSNMILQFLGTVKQTMLCVVVLPLSPATSGRALPWGRTKGT